MRPKRILIYAGIVAAIYLGCGAILLKTERIQRLYLFPGWSIKYGATDEDDSTVSADGPIVLNENNKRIKYQIFKKEGGKYSMDKSEVIDKDTLTCHIEETNDSFRFQLKDSLVNEISEYPLPGKMLIISDIEGNFKGFKSILVGNQVIDKQFNWTFGNNHLVLVGDFFDRGLNVTECLWLVYKLENEAEKQGGKVHFILGNHEMMNLKGQFKYLRDKYADNADTLKLSYEKWYSADSELGKWLRNKNGVEKIGDYLFVHAGLAKSFPKNYTLADINAGIRSSIDKNIEKDIQRTDVFIGSKGPLWYRGIAQEDENEEDLNLTLANFKAGKMIIGHTIFEEIQYLYNGKVIAIDLEHKLNSEKGKMYALWFEDGDFSITDQKGIKKQLK